MAIDESKLTAAPVEITIGGKKYMMRPMSDVMHSELNNYVRKRHVQLAVDAVKETMSPEFCAMVASQAAAEAHSFEWNSPPAINMFRDVDMVAYFVWVCCREHTKKISVDSITKDLLVGNVKENRNEVLRQYKQLNEIDVKNSSAPEE